MVFGSGSHSTSVVRDSERPAIQQSDYRRRRISLTRLLVFDMLILKLLCFGLISAEVSLGNGVIWCHVGRHRTALEIAAMPENIRGFGHIKN